MNLPSIREQRAIKVAEMRNLLSAAEAGKRALTADEQAKFDTLKSAVTDLEGQEARALFLDEAERRMQGQPADGAEHRGRADLESRVSLLRVMQAQMEGRALSGAEAEFSQEAERRTGRRAAGAFVPMSMLEKRVSTTSSAGEIVPTDHRPDQYINAFRNSLLARRLGVRVLTNLMGTLSIPKHQTSLTTGWVAENAALSASDMAFDSVSLAPKHCGALTELSRQLIMQSSPEVEQLVRDDMAADVATTIDSALIVGGSTNQPVGVLGNLAASGGVQSKSLSTLSWANVLEMLEAAEVSNAPVSSWLTHPSTATKLRSTLKASGIAGYLLEGGRMAELPTYVTNQVPEKSGSPNTGRLILGDWSQVMLGVWSELDILVNPYSETAYTKGNVLVRAMSTVGIAIRHPEAFVVADDIAL